MNKLVAACAVLLVLCAGCKKKAADESVKVKRTAFVNFTVGDVTVETAGVKAKAVLGGEITEGSKIITGAKSFADIAVDGSVIKILENTTADMRQLFADALGEHSELFLEQGKALVRISKKLGKGDSYRITTPTSVAAVRGTEFLVSEEEGASYIGCVEGTVEVRKAEDGEKTIEALADKIAALNASMEIYVEKDKPLSPQELSPSNRRMIADLLGEIREIQDDIRRRFEEQREEIREKVREQKEENRSMLEKQREENRRRLEEQRQTDKENLDSLRQTDVRQASGAEELRGQMQETKPDVSDVKPKLNDVKPDTKGFRARED